MGNELKIKGDASEVEIIDQPGEVKEATAKSLREELKKVLASEIPNIPRYLTEMMPENKVGAIIKLLPFALPPIEKESLDSLEGGLWF